MGGTAPDSINFVVLGRQETAAEFGKAGAASDITIHDKKTRDTIRTWVTPNGFPEKIQPLFQAINMAEHVVFCVDALDRFTGEQIVALDMLGMDSGILAHTYDVDEGRLESMIKGTVMEGYSRVPYTDMAEAVSDVRPSSGFVGGSPEVVVDHAFDVKGVGTVVLGRVAAGRIRKYDTLTVHPAGSEVLVKSIQMHDDPVDEASYPARVGLAVKGMRPEEIRRGDVLAAASGDVSGGSGSSSALKGGTEIELEYEPSRFYKADMTVGQGCMVSIGLQSRAAIVTAADTDIGSNKHHLGLRFEKPVVYHYGDIAVVLKPEVAPIRIAGSGSIMELV